MMRCLSVLLVLLAAAPVAATSAIQATVPELVASAELVVHGVVRVVEAADPKTPFRTSVEVELLEVIKGQSAEPILRLELPGGRSGGRTMRIPGMPLFATGDEVVLILERTARGFALAGLAQGVFAIDRTGGIAVATRHLNDLELVAPRKQPAPAADTLGESPRLDTLLRELRQLSGGAR